MNDRCESCDRLGPTIALTLGAIAHHAEETFNLCGHCMADHFAWVRSLAKS